MKKEIIDRDWALELSWEELVEVFGIEPLKIRETLWKNNREGECFSDYKYVLKELTQRESFIFESRYDVDDSPCDIWFG